MVHCGKGIIAIFGGFLVVLVVSFLRGGEGGGGGGVLGTGRWVIIIWDLDTFFMFSGFLSS